MEFIDNPSIATAISDAQQVGGVALNHNDHTKASKRTAHGQLLSMPAQEENNLYQENSSLICDDDVKKLSFPAKLHAILSHWDIEDIVSWMPHGRAWRIHNPEEFQRLIMPRFFHKCKYTSFLRQLNGW